MAEIEDFAHGSNELMLVELVCHPDTPCPHIEQLEVQIFEIAADTLHIRYLITGEVDEISWPDAAENVRTDQLWQHTCFEAFLKSTGGPSYREYNFSPSSQWAAYEFDSYRAGMKDMPCLPPSNWGDAGADWLGVEIELSGSQFVDAMTNFTAVIELKDGSKSYWALKHPEGPPDFHNPSCFILQLKAPDAA